MLLLVSSCGVRIRRRAARCRTPPANAFAPDGLRREAAARCCWSRSSRLAVHQQHRPPERLVTSGTILPATRAMAPPPSYPPGRPRDARASGGAFDYAAVTADSPPGVVPTHRRCSADANNSRSPSRASSPRSAAYATVAGYAQVPALFGPGSRSSLGAFPFVIALMVADVLPAGPLLQGAASSRSSAFGAPGVPSSTASPGATGTGASADARSSRWQQLSARRPVDTESDSGTARHHEPPAWCAATTHTALLGAEYFLQRRAPPSPGQILRPAYWNTLQPASCGTWFPSAPPRRGARRGTAAASHRRRLHFIGQEFGVVVPASVFGAIPPSCQRLSPTLSPRPGPRSSGAATCSCLHLLHRSTRPASSSARGHRHIPAQRRHLWPAIPAFVLAARLEQAAMRRGSWRQASCLRVTSDRLSTIGRRPEASPRASPPAAAG